jgi:hypothetical protein
MIEISQSEKAKIGGLARVALYGNPGTIEGRSKGGSRTVRLFQDNPRLARKCGFIIRKKINYPKKSSQLAEFVGIILGDGCLPGNHQLTITFNRITDYGYSKYVCALIKRLFSVNFYIRDRKDSNGADIVVSSSNLVDFLLKQGLIFGNKVKNQVDIPKWIKEKMEYRLACLRGLMDTDGGLYLHKYTSNGKIYNYFKLCFTNCSKPLLNFVFTSLKRLNYKAYKKANCVVIYAIDEVRRYFEEIGSHNQKNLNKLLIR